MKKSIRNNMFAFFVTFMGIFIMVSIALNVILLEKYYVIKNKELLRGHAKEINSYIAQNGNVQKKIEEIDRMAGVSISIADYDYAIIFTSHPKKANDYRLPKEIKQLIQADNKKEIYAVVQKNNESKKLVYITHTQKQEYIVITKQMKGIEESVVISNQFNILVGMAVLGIGSIFMLNFSNKITKPIIKMSHITEKISNLIFDEKIDIRNEDEIGILANGINTLSDKLKMSMDKLKNDIEFQKTLSRNMAHELKTPIGVIKGYAEGLTYGVADNSEMRDKYIKTIVDECDRMDSLVIEMLELSRLEADDYILNNVENIALGKLIESIKERLENKFMAENIKFLYEEDSHEIRIKANHELLERAISNLISNAIKYNDENKYIKISVKEEADNIQIFVYNTCKGIDHTEIEKIFDPFYKVDKARTRTNGGHGLGLSIVKTIVELHCGCVSVKNKKGGVEFCIKLPKNKI